MEARKQETKENEEYEDFKRDFDQHVSSLSARENNNRRASLPHPSPLRLIKPVSALR